MKTEEAAHEAANELLVDEVKAEKPIVVAVGVADAEEKQKLKAEEVQVAVTLAAVPYLVVL